MELRRLGSPPAGEGENFRLREEGRGGYLRKRHESGRSYERVLRLRKYVCYYQSTSRRKMAVKKREVFREVSSSSSKGVEDVSSCNHIVCQEQKRGEILATPVVPPEDNINNKIVTTNVNVGEMPDAGGDGEKE